MKISVIIPTLNEAQNVAHAIEKARQAGADQIVVADGGSSDDTDSIADSIDGCVMVKSEPGRGIQLNAGAARATGDILLFLHVDTNLSADGFLQIRRAAENEAFRCGAFKQQIQSERFVYRLIEFGNAQRVRWLGMAYGDQGIFVRRSFFEEMGGFSPVPLMEDFEFSRRIRAGKHRFSLCEGPIAVSSRRWDANGPIRQTFSNWLTVISYLTGTDVIALANRYQRQWQKKSGVR